MTDGPLPGFVVPVILSRPSRTVASDARFSLIGKGFPDLEDEVISLSAIKASYLRTIAFAPGTAIPICRNVSPEHEGGCPAVVGASVGGNIQHESVSRILDSEHSA
jgi:hypothetical protein